MPSSHLPAARATGLAGILIGLGGLVTVPLYFVYSGPPPAWTVLTRNLVTIGVCTAMIVFFTGLRRVLADDLVTVAGLVLTTVILIGVSLEGGAVIGASGPPIDPTTTGPLAHGAILIHGSIGRALTVLLLVAAGRAVRRTRALPSWTAWLAYAIAAVNLALVPSLYFGADAGVFYSALGWGNSAMTASLIAWWVFAVSVVLVRDRRSWTRTDGSAA
jgi:hypothetical protein